MIILKEKDKNILLFLILLIILIIINNLNIPWHISIIISALALLVFMKITNINSIKSYYPRRNRRNKQDLIFNQTIKTINTLNQNANSIRNDDDYSKRLIIKIIMIITILIFISLLILTKAGIYNINYFETWILITLFALEVLIMPKEQSLTIINIISKVVIYSSIIIGIVWVLLKYIFKLI